MKKILIYFFLVFSINVYAQYNSSIGVGVGKTMSGYRFFMYYKGDISFGSNYNHKIWNFVYSNIEYNYGHLSNDCLYMANFNNISFGPQFNILPKKTININYFFGVGYEWLQLKNDQDYNIQLQGITFINRIKIGYTIDEKSDFFIQYKIQQSDMKKNDEFSRLYYFHRIRFGSLNIGLRYKFSKKNENE